MPIVYQDATNSETCFDHLGYDIDSGHTVMQFKNRQPKYYHYKSMPEQLFLRWLENESPGTFWHRFIKGSEYSVNPVQARNAQGRFRSGKSWHPKGRIERITDFIGEFF